MENELIKKAQELRNRGFTTGEIADELNVSKDTARWLTLQTTTSMSKKEAPVDFAINWESLGGSSSRMRYVSAAMADMALKYGVADVVLGIAISGVPFATLMADVMGVETGLETSLASILLFHYNAH